MLSSTGSMVVLSDDTASIVKPAMVVLGVSASSVKSSLKDGESARRASLSAT